MITEDEAEETDCETEKSSDEEELAKERNENQQTTDEEEVRTPQGRVSQRMTPMPEEQMSRTMMPMSDLMSDSESIDEPMHSGETEGKPSQKRKASEMEDSEDETSRTPAPKRGETNRRGGTGITVAGREERKRMANRRKKARAKVKRDRVRCETEERTLDH